MKLLGNTRNNLFSRPCIYNLPSDKLLIHMDFNIEGADCCILHSRREDGDNQLQYTEWLKKYEDAHLGKYR